MGLMYHLTQGLKSENGLEASVTLLETTAGFDGSENKFHAITWPTPTPTGEHAAKVSELSMKVILAFLVASY